MKNLDKIDELLITELQGDIPLTINPYKTIAEKLIITEDELVKRLKRMQAEGYLKRVGAILRHQNSGYKANAMFVMQVKPEKIKILGELLAKEKLVSHCYERKNYENWPYNLYAMLHSRQVEDLECFVKKFVTQNTIEEYQLLFSEEELKKTSMVYF